MKTVVCAAGLGTRLGFNIPKCLLLINGKSILQRQLEILTKLTNNIVVVVGYKMDCVIDELQPFGVPFVVNENYATTSVVDSVKIGKKGETEEIVFIDGDVLFLEEDIRQLLDFHGPVACVKKNISNDNPVFVTVADNRILTFHREISDLEWAGICKVPADYFDDSDKYVYEALQHRLPLCCLTIDSVEIDTINDLEEVERWIKKYENFGKIGLK